MYVVMYKRKTEGAYAFTKEPRTQADAVRYACTLRRLGYEAIEVALPT